MRFARILAVAGWVVGCSPSDPEADQRRQEAACTEEAASDGREMYSHVLDAKPIRQDPSLKAIVPRHTLGAKLYVAAEKGTTAAYLEHAARCYARSAPGSGPAADPLHPGGAVPSIRVARSGSEFVVAIVGVDPRAGEVIWGAARAVVKANRAKSQ